MKKSLFAIAAVTAFAGAAQAQSSVTVYGILDVGFASTSSRGPVVSSAGTGSQTIKTNNAAFTGVGPETTSRLGFRGTEDLGGGMSAFFTVEMQLDPTQSNSFTNMTNRQSFIGLAQKGMGRVALGTQYTPVHLAVGATDPGQQNNMPGNVIYSVNAQNTTAGQTGAYTVRSNNAITVGTDAFAGFRAYGLYSQSNADQTQLAPANTSTAATNGGTTNATSWGLGLNYTFKKLYATAAYQSIKNESDMAVAPTMPAVNTAATTPTTNITSNQMYVAATYDFGILKAFAQYSNAKTSNNLNSNQYLKRSAQQLGVRGFVTPKIEGWASLGNGRFQRFGQGEPTANFTGYQLGSNYWLSKRTNLYAIYGSNQTSSTSNVGAAAASSYAIGARHTF